MPPPTRTLATPLSAPSRSVNVRSAKPVRSVRLIVSAARLSQMIGSESASDFSTWGGSTPTGKRFCTRLTAARTSFAASSKLRVSSNSTRMLDRPSRDEASINARPSIPVSWSSMICVMRLSTISAEAPRYWVETDTIGGSTAGNSRNGNV